MTLDTITQFCKVPAKAPKNIFAVLDPAARKSIYDCFKYCFSDIWIFLSY